MTFEYSHVISPRQFLETVFGPDEPGKCRICKGPAVEFRDDLSRREFGISHMCQPCQDKAFTPLPEDDEPEVE